MKEALYYKKINKHVQCFLCPHNCKFKEGKTGNCRVRKNINGKLISDNYGFVCSVHSDPIEKKPLYHFFPGKKIVSVGSIGCNLQCKFCQNWEISQTERENFSNLSQREPDEIISLATSENNNIGIAYTYNEPTVWFEYMLDIASKAGEFGLKNVMVTNGYINPEPLKELLKHIDAFSVDLKAFTDHFYKKITASSLDPVLKTLKTIRENNKHLEITNLIIPNHNDDEKDFSKMINWIKNELGKKTVLHLSRYYPTYKMADPPTTEKLLNRFYDIATSELEYVYIGNIRTQKGQNTYCNSCKTLVIERTAYQTNISGLDHNGNCLNCGNNIIATKLN